MKNEPCQAKRQRAGHAELHEQESGEDSHRPEGMPEVTHPLGVLQDFPKCVEVDET